MKPLLVLVAFSAFSVLIGESELLEGSIEKEVEIYNAKIRVIYDLLYKECPSYSRSRRLVDKDHPAQLEISFRLYDQLLAELIKCRNAKKILTNTTSSSSTQQATTPTFLATTPTADPITVTTTPSYQDLCRTADNYSEPWRLDHKGSRITPGGPHSGNGYNCDFHNEAQWFRFSGAGGTHMLDSCPKWLSCGAAVSYWTNHTASKTIGVETTVKAYGISGTNCTTYTEEIKVIRCSWDTDFDLIYKQSKSTPFTCVQGFCGMK